jgi:putative methyltransferase (TIGR04325 family)
MAELGHSPVPLTVAKAQVKFPAMSSTSLLKRLAPPVFVSLVRSIRAGRSYPTWQAATAAAESYDVERLNAFRIARYLANPGQTADLRGNPIGLVTRLLGPGQHIVDFGGSGGELALALRLQDPSRRLTVVESPGLVKAVRPLDGVVFSDAMPDAMDVFYTSSTIQYLDDPYGLMDQAFQSTAKAVIVVRNSFAEREIFRVQTSRLFDHGFGVIPPGFANASIKTAHRTIVESRIDEIAARRGFDKTYRVVLPRAGFGSDWEVSLVYLRSEGPSAVPRAG